MLTDSRKRAARTDFWIAAVLIAGGLVVSGFSLAQLAVGNRDGMTMAQSQAAPPVPDKPAEAKPGGTRPTTPPPEPARPDADARKAGAQPALPPAPAEKTAPPIEEKSK